LPDPTRRPPPAPEPRNPLIITPAMLHERIRRQAALGKEVDGAPLAPWQMLGGHGLHARDPGVVGGRIPG
jgi:hypothetical protein